MTAPLLNYRTLQATETPLAVSNGRTLDSVVEWHLAFSGPFANQIEDVQQVELSLRSHLAECHL